MSNDSISNNNQIQKKNQSNFLDYSLDNDLNREYEEFSTKLNKNNKIAVVANGIVCLGIYSYFKKYHKRIFDKKRGILRNFMSAILHSLGTITIVCFTNAIFLGLTPSNLKRKRELEDKLMYQSNYQINYDLFKDILNEDEQKKLK